MQPYFNSSTYYIIYDLKNRDRSQQDVLVPLMYLSSKARIVFLHKSNSKNASFL